MKRFHLLLSLIGACLISAAALGQTPAPVITSIHVDNTCDFSVSDSQTPCPIGPGMTLIITGENFGGDGNVGLCDCPTTTVERWTPTGIIAMVDMVTPASAIMVETAGGAFSNAVPYTAIAPVIRRIDAGKCTYIPGVTRHLCQITPGTQFTIVGDFFGRFVGGQVATCDCANATVDIWNPDWLVNPHTQNNRIVATAVDAECGSSVVVQAGGMWSNPVPYTTCGGK
jgi:hypothetical protein